MRKGKRTTEIKVIMSATMKIRAVGLMRQVSRQRCLWPSWVA